MMSDEEFDGMIDLIDGAIASGRVKLRFWTCPVKEHPWDRFPGSPTVEWDGDVATCLWRGCWRRSDDPVPRGECLCEDGDCRGECCGAGQCSCTPGMIRPSAAAD
jgi:hypothetical protein